MNSSFDVLPNFDGPYQIHSLSLQPFDTVPHIEVINEFYKRIKTHMVDTGAQVNLIKEHALSSNENIDQRKILVLKGISNVPLRTYGQTILTIHGQPSRFHVVPSSINIPCVCTDGDCKINYHTCEITVTGKVIPFTRRSVKSAHSNEVNCMYDEQANTSNQNTVAKIFDKPFSDESIKREVETIKNHYEKLRSQYKKYRALSTV